MRGVFYLVLHFKQKLLIPKKKKKKLKNKILFTSLSHGQKIEFRFQISGPRSEKMCFFFPFLSNQGWCSREGAMKKGVWGIYFHGAGLRYCLGRDGLSFWWG